MHTGWDTLKRGLQVAVVIGLLSLWIVPSAGAAGSFPFLWEAPGASSPESGSGAGELSRPFGVAADPSSGHIFTADAGNARVMEFDIWGSFVKAWGWGVQNGHPELQTCTEATGCRKGIVGTGPGQFSGMTGIAIDPVDGSVYVLEQARKSQGDPADNYRVQKFAPDGTFLLMFGGAVGRGPLNPGNLCTDEFIDEGDSCGAGAIGPANGEFRNDIPGTLIAVGPDRTVYVGDTGRVQEFGPNGIYKGQLTLPEGEASRGTRSLAVDPRNGDLYLTFAQNTAVEAPEKPLIYKHNEAGWQSFAEVGLGEGGDIVYGFPGSLATDVNGNLYVGAILKTSGKLPWQEVLSFTPDGTCISCVEEMELAKVESGFSLGGLATGSACALTSPALYVTSAGNSGAFARLTAYGPPPDSVLCPPPAVPPAISDQYAVSVRSGAAMVQAKINPRFWPDTTYYVEYGTGACSIGGCPKKAPISSASLEAGTVNAPITTVPVGLSGLSPDTTYHFRFVAESGGGGPVFGGEGTFTTFTVTLPLRTNCPNQTYRDGRAAFLPDCRAYEMVSPVDKEDGDILALGDITGYPANLQQSSVSGDVLTYSSYRSFAGNKSAPFTSQYLARRDPNAGWLSAGISPARGPVPILKEGNTLQSEFRAFSDDLCEGWILHDTDPILAAGAIEHYANLYRTDNCGASGYEALTQAPVGPFQEPASFLPELQGVTADGSAAIFKVKDKLTPDAVEGVFQLYEARNGQLSLVSHLPGGAPCAAHAVAGTWNDEGTALRTDSVKNALSKDGSRIYWSCGGKIYLREAGKSESRVVSGTVTSGEAQFWMASPNGSKALFATNFEASNERLYVYDAKSGASTLIATKTGGVFGGSDDLSSIYLISTEVRDTGAIAGKPNLYFYRDDAFTFIATLSDEDARQQTIGLTPSPVNIEPPKHSARVTPDGDSLTFMSTAPLTGFDNRDAGSGKRDAEVFFFSADTGKLSCPSCNSTGARPSGEEIEPSTSFWAAALLPPTNSQLYQPRYLSDDGSHLFFQSFERLVPRDENEKEDVYVFQPAGSKLQCQERGAETFLEAEAGCLSLISPGQGNVDAVFIDASPAGRDVFFTTAQGLVSHDPGLIDVYDAREGGGVPPPVLPESDCEGEACQNLAPAPQDAVPASANLIGSGNVKPKRRCPKGKHRVKRRGKSVCVKKKQGKQRHRRAGR